MCLHECMDSFKSPGPNPGQQAQDMALAQIMLFPFLGCASLHLNSNLNTPMLQVQDLTPAQIALFSFLGVRPEDGFVFAGDTAQTIARGVGFRFEDIRSVVWRGMAGLRLLLTVWSWWWWWWWWWC